MQNQSYYKWAVLAALLFAIVFGFATMHMIAPLKAEIDQDIGLTLAQVGMAVGLFTIASPIFSPIAGVLADKISVRWILAFAAILVGSSAILRGLAPSPTWFIVTMFIGGVGFACYGPIIPKALGAVFSSHELGRANGLVFSGFWIGTTLALALSADVLSPWLGGWRATMVFAGALSVVMAIVWVLVFRGGTAGQTASTEQNAKPKSFLEVLRLPEIWCLSLYYAFFAAGFYSVLSMLPSLLADRNIANGGVYTSVIPFTMIASNVLGGTLSDRVGRENVLMVCLVAFGLIMPGLLMSDGIVLGILLVLAGLFAGPIMPVASALPSEMRRVGQVSAGTAMGIFFMIGNTGAFLGPILAGWSTEKFQSPWPSFIVFTILALLSPVLIWKLKALLKTPQLDSG